MSRNKSNIYRIDENEIYLKITFSGNTSKFISFLRQCVSEEEKYCSFRNVFSCCLLDPPSYEKNSMILYGIRNGCISNPRRIKNWFANHAKKTECHLVSFLLQEDIPPMGVFRDWVWPIPEPCKRNYMDEMYFETDSLIGLCVDDDEYIDAYRMGGECKECFTNALLAVMKGNICDVPFFITVK